MQNRQHRPVPHGIQKLIPMPAPRKRTGFGFPVSDDTSHQQLGMVEGRPIGMGQGIAQFTALVDRTGRFRRDMARNTARERKLFEQAL